MIGKLEIPRDYVLDKEGFILWEPSSVEPGVYVRYYGDVALHGTYSSEIYKALAFAPQSSHVLCRFHRRARDGAPSMSDGGPHSPRVAPSRSLLPCDGCGGVLTPDATAVAAENTVVFVSRRLKE